jgi:heme exporter protein C
MSSSLKLYTFSSPANFYKLAGYLIPWFYGVAVLVGLSALYIGFFVAPTDATQGEAYRIIFVHVPAAWMSMILYLTMAMWAAVGWAFNALDGGLLGQTNMGHLVGMGC